MDEVIALLETVIAGAITPEEFAEGYIVLWREIRDEQDVAIEALSQKAARVKLAEEVYTEKISKEQFAEEWAKLDALVTGTRIKPGTRESQIVSHIMVEADAYEPDPHLREHYQIGEKELLEAVSEALQELKAIRSLKYGGGS